MSATESFTAAANRTPGHVHILLMATGSVASVKIPLIVEELLQHERVKIQVVATKASRVFFDSSFLKSKHGVNVWQDEDEWTSWKKMGDSILHIELRRWADLVLIAPCSANTLAKLAGGLCDNLATSILRALPPVQTQHDQTGLIAERPGESTSVQVWVFPGMNTFMYEHPLTAVHLKVVKETLKYRVEGPIAKGLACGDVGLGAMTEWRDIVKMVVDHYHLERK